MITFGNRLNYFRGFKSNHINKLNSSRDERFHLNHTRKSQTRKLKSDPSGSQDDSGVSSPSADEIPCLFERDLEDITNRVDSRMSKILGDTEFGQREILRLKKNLEIKKRKPFKSFVETGLFDSEN